VERKGEARSGTRPQQSKVTLDHYAHLSPEFVHAQRGIMDQMYTGGAMSGHPMDTVQKTGRIQIRK